MIGMDRTTGTALAGDDHLIQSLAELLTTPLGSRVMRRDYGSLLFELLDRPLNAATRLLCAMAVAMAVARWEPRLTVSRAELTGDPAQGQIALTIEGIRADRPGPNALTRLTIPLRLGATIRS